MELKQQLEKALVWLKVCEDLGVAREDKIRVEKRRSLIPLLEKEMDALVGPSDAASRSVVAAILESLDTRAALGATYDHDPSSVIDDRFAHEVAVHSHRQICKFSAPISPERIRSNRDRRQIALNYGFQFDEVGKFLTAIGFWKKISSGLPAGDVKASLVADDFCFGLDLPEELFHSCLNILNGGAEIDYESCFPAARDAFDAIAELKFHEPADKISVRARKSFLSVPDILLALTLVQATKDAGYPAIKLAATILDSRVGNSRRIALAMQLAGALEVFANDPTNTWLRDSLNAMNRELFVPLLQDEAHAERPLDVVIPLHGGHCENAARDALTWLTKYPAAFIMPLGAWAPHQAKAVGCSQTRFCEAQSMVAALLEYPYRDRFGGYPDAVPMPAGGKAHTYDILPSSPTSTDTVTNVKEAKPILEALQKARDLCRPLEVLLVTSRQHAQRARVEFHDGLPPQLANVHATPQYPPVAVMENLGSFAKPVGIGNLFCEVVKRLYMVSVR